MNSLTRLTICLLLFTFSGGLLAQVEKPTEIMKEKSTYPAANEVDPEMAVFLSVFEDKDVGNLAVFSSLEENLPIDYFYTGTEVEEPFFPLFNPEMEAKLEAGETKLYAIYKVKGNAGQRFILRMPTGMGRHTIALFEPVNGTLEMKHVLAFAHCGDVYCKQQDAWLTDLDGDTDLDLLFKRRYWDKIENITQRKETTILLQDDAGIFREADMTAVNVRLNRFIMEDLEKKADN